MYDQANLQLVHIITRRSELHEETANEKYSTLINIQGKEHVNVEKVSKHTGMHSS